MLNGYHVFCFFLCLQGHSDIIFSSKQQTCSFLIKCSTYFAVLNEKFLSTEIYIPGKTYSTNETSFKIICASPNLQMKKTSFWMYIRLLSVCRWAVFPQKPVKLSQTCKYWLYIKLSKYCTNRMFNI